ncbi:MAG: glycosyltransferase family 2 protein [Erysipelotrichaceae bacterium]|nr:glycosyltransferase family 2 protein [Erysipelotrichaceae bacterium]
MISLILPVYNVENYITGCLKSIAAQTFQDFEIILVNDGSKDNSSQKIKAYLGNTTLNWTLYEQENAGVSHARNRGLEMAKGDDIVFMDADDVISEDFLALLHEKMTKHDVDFVFCNYTYVDTQTPYHDDNDQEILYQREELIKTFLKREISFVLPSMMFRKRFLLENGLSFNEKIRFSEDQLFIWETIFKSHQTIYLPKKMYGYYLREQSTMTSSSFSKIHDGYLNYKQFTEELAERYPQEKELIKMILPRWKLGTLYTAAKLLKKEEYLTLYNEMNGKDVLKQLKDIHENKAYLLGFVCSLSPDLMYVLSRRLKL